MRFIASQPGSKPPGSVITFIRRLRQGHARGSVDVPCGTCTACCRSHKLEADLLPEEVADFPEAVPLRPEVALNARSSGYGLPKNPDGTCVHLVDNKCSIYHRRPRSCRVYDCRLELLMGVVRDDDPVMREALEQWAPFALNERADRLYLIAVRLAMIDGGAPRDGVEALARLARTEAYLPKAAVFEREVEALSPQAREEIMAWAHETLKSAS